MNEDINQMQKSRQVETSERYLAFSLCEEQYAIPLLQVKEVIGMTEATPIPCTPVYFKGIINLRGQVISVVDLRTKLRLSKAEIGAETSIIILDLSPLCLGVIVDSINCVLAVTHEDLTPAPDIESSVTERHLTGVAKKDNRLTLLLDIKSALSIEDIKLINNQNPKQVA